MDRQAWIHSSPLFTFAGMSFIYNPMKMGMRGLYLSALRRRRVDRRGRGSAGRRARSWCRPWPSCCCSSPRFADADLSSLTPGVDRLGAAAADAAPAARRTVARRIGVEQLLDDRGRHGVHLPAAGGADPTAWIGRHPDGRRRSASSTTTATAAAPSEVGEVQIKVGDAPPRVLPRPRGDGGDVVGRVAAVGRPRRARRRRLPLHPGPQART